MIFDDTPEIPENLISLNEISLSENNFDDTPVIPENLISFEDIVPPDETNSLADLKIMREKFIQRNPPKSSGTDYFNSDWIKEKLKQKKLTFFYWDVV